MGSPAWLNEPCGLSFGCLLSWRSSLSLSSAVVVSFCSATVAVTAAATTTIDHGQTIKHFAYIIRDAWDNSVLICSRAAVSAADVSWPKTAGPKERELRGASLSLIIKQVACKTRTHPNTHTHTRSFLSTSSAEGSSNWSEERVGGIEVELPLLPLATYYLPLSACPPHSLNSFLLLLFTWGIRLWHANELFGNQVKWSRPVNRFMIVAVLLFPVGPTTSQ